MSTIQSLYNALQRSLCKLVSWTELNHIVLHPNKSKFMSITTTQKRQNIKTIPTGLKVDGKLIEEVNSHRLLGLNIDNNLSWSNHIFTLAKKISKKVFQLNRIKHFFNQRTRKLFFYAYNQPDIDYVSISWDLASKNCLKPLESVYRHSLKLILLRSSSLDINQY